MDVIEFAVTAFVTLVVVLDPPGVSVLFASLAQGETEDYRRRLAVRGVLIAAAILLAFTVAGAWFLRALGVSIDAFRIAGGILLFMVAIDMLLAHGSALRRTTTGEQQEAIARHDISVFPVAIPLIAGPGAMTSMVLLMGNTGGDPIFMGVVLAVLALVLSILFVTLIAAERVARALGVTGTNVITRVLGLILAALAVQFVIDGLRGTLATF